MSADVHEWFAGAQRVLFIHAHPDDETITTGGTIAALSEAGRLAAVLTLTRGEQGEVMPGVRVPEVLASDGIGSLATLRTGELAAALSALGVTAPTQHAFLGSRPARVHGLDHRVYEDSGMQWHPDGTAVAADAVGSAALSRAPFQDALEDALALAESLRSGGAVDAVVSYDEDGGYGHPDHVTAHQLARGLAEALSIPFWIIASDERSGAVEYRVDTWIAQKTDALRAHASQLVVRGDSFEFTGGQVLPIAPSEWFAVLDDYTERHSSKGVS